MDAKTGKVPAAITSPKRKLKYFLVVVPIVAILVSMIYRYARLEIRVENNTEQINKVQTGVEEGRREMRSDLKDLNKQMREIEQRLTKFETRMDSNTGKMDDLKSEVEELRTQHAEYEKRALRSKQVLLDTNH